MVRNDESFEDGDFLVKDEDDEESAWSLILHFHWTPGYSTLLVIKNSITYIYVYVRSYSKFNLHQDQLNWPFSDYPTMLGMFTLVGNRGQTWFLDLGFLSQ